MEEDEALPTSVAEQIAWHRRQWYENRRFHLTPPARPNAETHVHVTRLADGTLQYTDVQGPVLEIPPMPPQEDEITLLPDGGYVPRPMRLADLGEPVVVDWDALGAELLDTPAPRAPSTIIVDGIEEISMSEAAAAPVTRKRVSVKAKDTIKVIESLPIHNGHPVYMREGVLYQAYPDYRELAYSVFSYHGRISPHTNALTLKLGETPCFFVNTHDMAEFKKLLTRVDITVAPGKSLAFFTGTEYYCGDDNLVIIVFDGETIRYGGRNRDERIMRLDHPVWQKPEQIFDAISRFLTSSVAGAAANIKDYERKLSRIKDLRAEEAYLYLSDIRPGEGSESIHSFILGQIETTYQTNLVQSTRLTQDIAAERLRVANAKSPLPSGRKGVPLRNAYLKAPALTDLLDYFKIVRNGASLNTIFAFKKDLVLTNIDTEGEVNIAYGRPEVTIQMNCSPGLPVRGGTFIQESRGVMVRSADKKAFLHPHIETDVRWCMGTYVQPVNHAIVSGNIPLAASLIWRYLSEYNPASPLINVETCRAQMAGAANRDLIIRRK